MSKKLLSFLLCVVAVLTLSFAGCGEDSDDDSTNQEASARKAVTINMMLVSEKEISSETEALVEEAFNELTQSKYTTKVDFVFLTEDEYFDVLDEKLAAAAEAKENEGLLDITLPGLGTPEETTEVEETTAETIVNELGQRLLKYPDIEENQIDIIFLSGRDRLIQYATEGKLKSLDTNLNATSKVLRDYIYPSFLDQVVYEKNTYAIPNNHLIGDYTYLLVNKELAEKYYIDVTRIKSFADCKELIIDIGTNEAGIPAVLEYADPTNMHYWLGGDDVAILASELPVNATAGTMTKMKSVFEISSFTEHMLLMKTCEDNGWFAADPANTEKFGVAIMNGGYEIRDEYADDYEVIVLSYPSLADETVYESMFAVTSYTADFDRAMEIITFINTDVEAKNILQYGVEDIHYEFDDDGNFVSLSDDYAMNNLYTGNSFLAYTTEDMPADIWENAKAANRESLVSPYIGISSDWGLISEGFIETLREISDPYIERMNACANAEELAAFFETAIEELSSNEIFKASFSTEEDSSSPNAIYTRWFERVYPEK